MLNFNTTTATTSAPSVSTTSNTPTIIDAVAPRDLRGDAVDDDTSDSGWTVVFGTPVPERALHESFSSDRESTTLSIVSVDSQVDLRNKNGNSPSSGSILSITNYKTPYHQQQQQHNQQKFPSYKAGHLDQHLNKMPISIDGSNNNVHLLQENPTLSEAKTLPGGHKESTHNIFFDGKSMYPSIGGDGSFQTIAGGLNLEDVHTGFGLNEEEELVQPSVAGPGESVFGNEFPQITTGGDGGSYSTKEDHTLEPEFFGTI